MPSGYCCRIRTMDKVIVDIMMKDIFIATMRIEPSLRMVIDYYGDKPVVSMKALCREIEDRRPTLRGKAYKILPCTDKFVFNYDLVCYGQGI